MTEAINATVSQQAQAERDAQAETSWRERALNTEEALKAAHTEIRTQRERIGILIGQVRGLQAALRKCSFDGSKSPIIG